MFFSCHTGQRLEPCGYSESHLFQLPIPSCFMRNHICCLQDPDLFPHSMVFFNSLIHFFRKTFLHHFVVEYIFTKNLCNIHSFQSCSSSHPFCDKPEQNFSVTFLLLYRKLEKDAPPLIRGRTSLLTSRSSFLILAYYHTSHIFGKCKVDNLIFLFQQFE